MRIKKYNHRLKAIAVLFVFVLLGLQAESQTTDPQKGVILSGNSGFGLLQTQKFTSSNRMSWVPIGPGLSGYNEFYWCHPTDKNVMFQAPDLFNSYGTWDNGKSWQTIKDYDGSGLALRQIKDMDFSRQNPDLGFAVDHTGGLFKTTDRGRTWKIQKHHASKRNYPTPKKDFALEGRYSTVTVDPTDDDIWYIGGGDFWNVKANQRTKNGKKGRYYAYATYGVIYRTTDGGNSWKKLMPVPDGDKKSNFLDIGEIVVSPKNPNRLIIATNQGVFASNNKGDAWFSAPVGLPNNLPRDMTSHYNTTTRQLTLYLVEQTFYELVNGAVKSKGGVFKSTDEGRTWTNITGNLGINMRKINRGVTKQKFFATVNHWLGANVNRQKPLPTSVLSVFNRIKVNPKNPKEIYLGQNVKHAYGFAPGDLWKSDDGGDTWYPTIRSGKDWRNGTDGNYWSTRAGSHPTRPNAKFAHLDSEVKNRTENFGMRFLEVNAEGVVYAGVEQQTLKSTDGGASWKQDDDDLVELTVNGRKSEYWYGKGASNLPGRFILFDTGVEGRYFFCSGEHGLWQSAPSSVSGGRDAKGRVALHQLHGQSSPHVNGGPATSIATVAVHPKDPKTIYTLQFRQSHRGKFRKSTDGGLTWENVSQPITARLNPRNDWKFNIFQSSLLIDPLRPTDMYFNIIAQPISEVFGGAGNSGFPGIQSHDGVYKTTDEGKTWSKMNNGIPAKGNVRRIFMDKKKPWILYAALNEGPNGEIGGLYKTTDRAKNWFKVSIPSEIKSVNNVFVDAETEDLYIACGRSKGSNKEGGVWKMKGGTGAWAKIFEMPFVWQVETSPLDPSLVTVVAALPHKDRGATHYNPGAYISENGGRSWLKVNRGLGHNYSITDFKPDPKDKSKFWLASWGSGWHVGTLDATVPSTPPSNGDDTAQGPFQSLRRTIPGAIQAEDFDIGGQGIAYKDTDGTNQGSVYRADEAVDLREKSTDDYFVFDFLPGEWLEYSINATQSTDYTFYVVYAHDLPNTAPVVEVYLDGVKLKEVTAATTEGWKTFKALAIPNISVSSGNHLVRIQVKGAGVINFDKWSAWPTAPSQRSLKSSTADLENSIESDFYFELMNNPIERGEVIHVAYKGGQRFYLIDTKGRIMKEIVTESSQEISEMEVGTKDLPSGMYILKSGPISRKFMVK